MIIQDVKSILKNLEIRVSKLNPSFSRYVVVDSINSADDSNDDNQVLGTFIIVKNVKNYVP